MRTTRDSASAKPILKKKVQVYKLSAYIWVFCALDSLESHPYLKKKAFQSICSWNLSINLNQLDLKRNDGLYRDRFSIITLVTDWCTGLQQHYLNIVPGSRIFRSRKRCLWRTTKKWERRGFASTELNANGISFHFICNNLTPFCFRFTQKMEDNREIVVVYVDRVWPLKCFPFQHDACRCNKIETGKVLELLLVSIHLNGRNPEFCFMVSCRGSIHYLSFLLGSNSISVRIRSLWHAEVEPMCRGLNFEPILNWTALTNGELT